MSAKASIEDSEADSEGGTWSTGGVHPGIGAVASLVFSLAGASLLLATGIAAAQIPPTPTSLKPGMVKDLRPGVLQVAPGTTKQIPPGVSDLDPETLTEVPSLIGHRQEELPAILERRFLYLGPVAYANSDDPAGVVTSQTPDAGQTVRRGTTVAVTVSRGQDTVSVPEVITQPLSVAKEMLARADLNVGMIVEMESESSVETVLDQRPLSGVKVSRGSSVDLTIAVALKKVPVPSLTGLTEEASRQRLAEAGLAEGGRVERNAEESAGTIIEQDPVAGTMVPPGTPVTRVVSAGPLPVVKVPLWVIPTILGALGALILAGVGSRSLTNRRKLQRRDNDKPIPGLEIRAVQDEGRQRLSRSPAAVSSIGLVAHPDDTGRQRIRLKGDSDGRAGGGHGR